MPRSRLSLHALALLCAGLLAGACVPAEPEVIEFREFDPLTTVMGVIQEEGVLRAGVPSDHPSLAQLNGAGEYEGLVVDLANSIADTLRVELEIVAVPSDDLLDLLPPSPPPADEAYAYDAGEADVVFPVVPITERAVRRNAFTDPYLVGHQQLLARGPLALRDDFGAHLEPLSGEKVCSVGKDPTIVDLAQLNPEIDLLRSNDPELCYEGLVGGGLDVVAGPDVVLRDMQVRFQAEECPGEGSCGPAGNAPQIVGDALNTVGYGAVVVAGASGWRSFVEGSFRELETEGGWFDPIGTGDDIPPELTVEESAALYPVEAE